MADTYASFKSEVVNRKREIFENHSVRSIYHPIWHTAMAFFEGEQWKVWSKIDKRLNEFKPSTLSRKMVVNRVEKIVTTFVAHFMQQLPSCLVNPNSNTPDDENAADLAEKILKVEYVGKLEEVLGEYFYWKWIIGTGIRGLFWDPKASGEVKLPQYDENGQEISSEIRTVPEIGQLFMKTINPFNFFQVGGPTIDDCTEILYVEPLPLEIIKSQYDFEAVEESLDIHLTSAGYKRDYHEWHKEKFEKRAKVFHYWKKACDGFDKGVYSVIINDKVIEYRDNPYLQYNYNYPFFKSCAIPVPGQFWGKSPVEQVRRIQIAYNYVYSILLQTIERMGKLKWWVPRNSNVETNALEGPIGEMVQYTSMPNSPPPTQANLSPVPYYYLQMLELLDKAFEDVTGFHEVKSARLPTGANNPSGVMVNLLLEQDETRLTPAIKQYLASLKGEAKLYLKMVQELYLEDRVLKICGVEKEAEIMDFKGASIKDNNDVQIELAPVLSESRSAWEQTVFQSLQMGIMDARTAIQKLKLQNPKTVIDELADERLALRENIEMRQGQPRIPRDWENEEIHLRIHEGFLRTATFEKLDPKVQQIFLDHREATQKIQAQKFQQRIAAQQQLTQATAGQPNPTRQAGQPGPQPGQAPPGIE
jgi:hypothetical protein